MCDKDKYCVVSCHFLLGDAFAIPASGLVGTAKHMHQDELAQYHERIPGGTMESFHSAVGGYYFTASGVELSVGDVSGFVLTPADATAVVVSQYVRLRLSFRVRHRRCLHRRLGLSRRRVWFSTIPRPCRPRAQIEILCVAVSTVQPTP